ncbi:hypothetical protein WJX82_001349 [Trebouxia sp. C0006]
MHSVRALHTLPSLASWANSQQPMLVQKLCAEAVRAQLKQAPCAVNIHRGFAAQAHVRPQIRGQQPRQRKIDPSGTQGLYLVAFTVAMIGVTYASVPLYRMFCQATGYGGTVQQGSTVEDKLKQRELVHNAELEAAAAARDLTVFFNADVSDSLPWKFTPTQRSVSIKPGDSTLAFYTAQNLSDKSITGVSTYNVTPQQAGVYFNKIQCFCFEEQKLRPGEKIDMPVFFYVDPEFATDPKLRSFNQLTLSYTFFKVNEEDAEEDDDAPDEQATA